MSNDDSPAFVTIACSPSEKGMSDHPLCGVRDSSDMELHKNKRGVESNFLPQWPTQLLEFRA